MEEVVKKLSVKEALEQGKFGKNEIYKTNNGRVARVFYKMSKENISHAFVGQIEDEDQEEVPSQWDKNGINFLAYFNGTEDDLVEYIGHNPEKEKWNFECFIPNEARGVKTLYELVKVSSTFKINEFTDVKVRVTIEVITE